MSFGILALISAAAVLGPLLAIPQGLRLPTVFGELLAGIVLGNTGFGVLHPANPTFAFLANVGFALVMFVAGTHVPVRDQRLRKALPIGTVRAVAVGLLAVPLAVLIAITFGTGHAALYAVLLASSSAALVLPTIDSLRLGGPSVLQLLPQVAIADAACIVALPLAIDPRHAVRAAMGSVVVIGGAAALYVLIEYLERSGIRRRAHRVSERRKFALEMRVNLAILFSLAALAVATRVSVMLAGFSFGLAVAAVGEPRRLARQLFALTEGFLGPLFFVWLGASLDIRGFGRQPSLIVLGVALGVAAAGAHIAMRFTGQPVPLGGLAAAQLGLPAAAATLGTQLHLLEPAEPAALVLGAIVTIGVAVWSAALAARAGLVVPDPPRQSG